MDFASLLHAQSQTKVLIPEKTQNFNFETVWPKVDVLFQLAKLITHTHAVHLLQFHKGCMLTVLDSENNGKPVSGSKVFVSMCPQLNVNL